MKNCPNCGYCIEAFTPIRIGLLSIPDQTTVMWGDDEVHLTPCERLIVLALAGARGGVVKRMALAEITGADEARNPENLISVFLRRIRVHFRDIDPSFDEIVNVWGTGLRWRMSETLSTV